MKHEYIISEVEKGLELENGSICGPGKIDPLTDIRVCIYKILTVYFADSLSYSSMDNNKFAEVYSKVLDVIAKELGLGSSELDKEIISFM